MSSLLAVILLFFIAYMGAGVLGMESLFGIVIPYLAGLIFVAGFILKILDWASSAVPFRIPTTCGQGKTLDWIPQNRIDNPYTKSGVIVRMLLEILLFRSLFRNLRFELNDKQKLVYFWEKWLWLGAILFHYAFLVTLIRHLRLFTEPVPFFVTWTEYLDSFFRIEIAYEFIHVGLPGIFISGIVLLAAAVYLLLRRMFISQVNYISLFTDYFPLFLIIAIAISGIYMRYIAKVDVVAIKELTMGLVTFRPVIPEGVAISFYVHLFFVSFLFAYFPFSKLMHLGGIFMSSTRNLPNNTRAERHVNPWNYPVHVHTYEEYEDEFREKMIEAGLPVDKKE